MGATIESPAPINLSQFMFFDPSQGRAGNCEIFTICS